MSEKKVNPFVSVIIVNWNEKKLLEECLTSIKDNTDYPNFKVIVVDNGSTDGSVKMIRRNFPRVKLIQNKTNLGFAKANNQGIKYALKEGADYVFLLNNDTKVIQSDWLARMVEIAEANPNVGIVGCKLVYPDGRIQHAGGGIDVASPDITFHSGVGKLDNGSYDEIKDVDYVTGAAFMIKKEVMQKIGLLDERFPLYFEETDYCVRAKMAGYRIIYNPTTKILHYEGVTVKKRQPKRYYLMRKSRIRFILLNFPLRCLLGRLKHEFKTIIRSVIERKDKTRKTSLLNAKLRNDWYPNLTSLLNVYSENLKSLTEILQKRRNRTSKVWY